MLRQKIQKNALILLVALILFFSFIHSWLCLFNSYLKSPMAVCVNLLCATTTWSIVISIQFNPLNSPVIWTLHVTEAETDIGREETQSSWLVKPGLEPRCDSKTLPVTRCGPLHPKHGWNSWDGKSFQLLLNHLALCLAEIAHILLLLHDPLHILYKVGRFTANITDSGLLRCNN